jgi:ABC-type sugar transport system substrate-binding protein
MRNRFRVVLSSVLFFGLSVALVQAAETATQSQTTKPAAKAAQPASPAKAVEPGDEYPRPPKPAKHYRIGVLLPQLNQPHYIGQAYGYTDEAEKLGATVILHDAGGYQYIERQVSQLEDLIASKVDAIDISTVSPTAIVSSVEAATAAGIPVFGCNSIPRSDKVVAKVLSDDSAIGEMQADAMAKLLNGKGNVVMLSGAAGVAAFSDRSAAFRKRLAAVAPGVKILGEQNSMVTPQDGVRLMEDFMQTFPQINGVFNGADMLAIGAAQAILAAGKAGKTVITTTDFQPDTQRFMRSGVVNAAVVQQTVVIGRWCIRATINYLEKRPVPKELHTPLLLVTKETEPSIDFRGVRAPQGWAPPARSK